MFNSFTNLKGKSFMQCKVKLIVTRELEFVQTSALLHSAAEKQLWNRTISSNPE